MNKFAFASRGALLAVASVLFLPFALAQVASAQASAKKASAPDYVLSVRAQKEDVIYAPREEITFLIELSGNKEVPETLEAEWKLSKDRHPPVTTGRLTLRDGKGVITGSLDEPGFLLCDVTVELDGKKIRREGAAGISPLLIEPTALMPDDFDAFWSEQLSKLAEVPLNIRLTPLPALSNDKISVFDVQADAVDGVPVSGYLSLPRAAAPKSLPAIITLHGAGVRSASLNRFWAQNGFIALDINAHGLPNGKPAAFYEALSKGELRRYVQIGREDREKTYMKNMFLRVIRGIDVLAAQPQWDGVTLVAHGSSQGAAQSIFAGGMDDRVTMVVAGVPAMSDHTGVLFGRASGSWWWLQSDSDRENQKMIETSRYYDSVNFARRAKAPAFFTVGLIDRTCPPTAVYSMFNSWANPQKSIYNDIEAGHGMSVATRDKMYDAILKHVSEQKGAMQPR